MDAVKTACEKRAHKFKWEERLTDEQREFVAGLDRMIWQVAINSTPKAFRNNEHAVSRSYDAVIRSVIRSSKKYDKLKSAPTTYTMKLAAKAAFNSWKPKGLNTFLMNMRFGSIDSQVSDPNSFGSPDTKLGSIAGYVADYRKNECDLVDALDSAKLALSSLDNYPREKQFIIMNFGLDGNTPMLNVEIARSTGVPKSTVRQIIQRGLQIMRESLHAEID
jgi:DNA-directed RNA polymerase specialized sigma24 family protein